MQIKKFLIINGPNLNMLSKREPEIYGSHTLDDIISYTNQALASEKVHLEWYQSNIEGEIVTRIQEAHNANDYSCIIINPAAYTHTSVAILDALLIVRCPIIEVHLTNTHKREEFRQSKLTSKAASAILEGLGMNSYLVAIKSQLLK
jgi:3-dehydroquinate dehydratase-2